MKKSIINKVSMSLAFLLGVGAITGVSSALFVKKNPTKAEAATGDTITLSDILDPNVTWSGGSATVNGYQIAGMDNRGTDCFYTYSDTSKAVTFFYIVPAGKTVSSYTASITADKELEQADFNLNNDTVKAYTREGSTYTYSLNTTFDPVTGDGTAGGAFIYVLFRGYTARITAFSITIGEPSSPVTIAKGTGVKSVYLSETINATSGSDSGTEFATGATVYGFAVLAKGYNAPSGWTLVSGTAHTENAKYRVGSVTAGTSNFGTINASLATYSISYTLNGGSVSSNPTSYNVNSNAITLNNPTKTGYTFKGWTGSNGSTPQTSVTIAKGSTGDKSYTANWQVNTSNISYTLNGGALPSGKTNPSTYNVETATFTLNNPQREGHNFVGWTGSNGSTPQATVTITKGSTGDKSYTANWTLAEELQTVVDAINNLGGPTNISYPGSKTNLENAELLYNSLSSDLKNVLNNDYKELVDELADDREEYDALRSAAINDTINKIDAIGEAVSYPGSREVIFAAEGAFYELDGEDQNATVIPNMDNMIAARNEYDAQKAVKVQEVIEAIDAIGNVSYPESKEALEHAEALFAALANEEKNTTSVTNLDVLSQARADYNTERGDEIQDVIDAINAIVSPFDINREDQIANAQELYDLLDESDKDVTVVTNLERFENVKAADTVADLIEELASITDKDTFLGKVFDANLAYNYLSEAQQAFIPASLKAILDDNVAAMAVIFKIDDIGSVTFEEGVGDSLDMIIDAESSYDALSNDQQAIVNRLNHDVLTHDRTVYDNVKNVADLIKAIPEASESSAYYDAVDAAKAAYDALSEEEQDVINATVSKDFDKILNDQVAARSVIELIQNIGEVTYNGGENDSSAAIIAAKFGYQLLTGDQKTIVNGVNCDDLTHKSEIYGNVNDVALLIGAIPEPSDTQAYYDAVDAAKAAYDALTDEEEAIINAAENINYEKVLEDNVKASEVIKEIQAIGDVTYNKGDGDSLAAIESAETNYANLTEEQKTLVDAANKSDLDYDRSVYDNVDATVDLINAIGQVSHTEEKDSKDDLDAARTAYDALNEEEKSLVAGYNDSYQTLVDDEAVYEAMVKIDTIGEASYNTRSEDAINEARKAYDSLTDSQKEQLGNEYAGTLTKAEDNYATLKKNADIMVICFLVAACLLILGGIWLLIVLLKKKKNNDDQNGGSGNSNKEPVKAMSVGGFLPFVILTSHYLDASYLALYVLVGVAVLLWISILVIAIMKKKQIGPFKKKAEVAKAEPQSPNAQNEDEEEVITITDEKGNIFNIRYIKSFTAKLIQSPDETKKYYEELKNYVLSYKKTTSRVSWHYDSVNSGRNQVIKFSIRGKTLCVYYALDANDYLDTKYKVEAVDSKKFEEVPCLYRIKNDRRLGYAKDLIDTVMSNLGLVKGEEQHEVYSDLLYEENKPLIARGLIKEQRVQVNKPVEQVVSKKVNDEGDEIITTKDNKGNYFEIRYIKSFLAKLSQASDETKAYYNELKNYVLTYKGVHSRVSWHFDSINVGRNQVIKFSVRGKTLCVYYALNANDYIDTKYKVEAVDSKKFEEVPCLYRIKNDRRRDYAKDLIDTVMANVTTEKGKESNDDFRIPFEETKALLEKGLIKEVKILVK